ncbi:uncharacterized protein DEA37_0009161 [Paragonimus westermani]|uniref:Integrase catalytic domain-containing protein n=1 Tax=Paragonimus westermani TaxID=34504 RepID=A0A5J4NGF9_9TREM|nr:uncharacterized protein DEA37_0009161 [Paragonimus westermani]
MSPLSFCSVTIANPKDKRALYVNLSALEDISGVSSARSSSGNCREDVITVRDFMLATPIMYRGAIVVETMESFTAPEKFHLGGDFSGWEIQARRSKFHERRQRHGEDIQTFARHLKRPARQAFSSAPVDKQAERDLERLVEGVTVLEGSPTELEQAIGVGQRIEAIAISLERNVGSQHVNPNSQASLQAIETGYPNEIVGVVLMGPLPETCQEKGYILVMVGDFTKWTEFVPLWTIDAPLVVKAIFSSWVHNWGAPKQLHFGKGTNFESAAMYELCGTLRLSGELPYEVSLGGALSKGNCCLTDQPELVWIDVMYALETLISRLGNNGPIGDGRVVSHQATGPSGITEKLDRKQSAAF